MKKLFITVGIVAFLGMSAPAVANQKQQPENTNNKESGPKPLSRKRFYNKTDEIESLLREQSKLLEEHTNIREKRVIDIKAVRELIKSNEYRKRLSTKLNPIPELISADGQIDGFFLERLDSYYYRLTKEEDLHSSYFLDILYKSMQNIKLYKTQRDKISKSLHYGANLREASNMAFKMANNRFQAIRYLLSEIQKTNDLKGIAELQARIDLMLNAIQDEEVKLQALTHFRDSQHALINQRKRKLYTAVFNHENKDMPTLTSISSITSTQ